MIEVIDNKSAGLKLKKELLKFIFDNFNISNTRERKLYYFSPTYKHLMIRKNGKIISYLRIIKRRVNFANMNILVGGIGDVSTISSFRNKGYASKLLKKAFDIFKKENFDIAVLQTDIKKGKNLYGKVGFVPANRSYKFKTFYRKIKKVNEKDVMIAPVNSLEKMLKIINSDEILYIGKGDW